MCRESTGCAASSAGKQSLWDVQWLVFFGQKTLTLAVLGGFGLWQLSENAGREGISFQWCHPLSCVGYSSTFFVEIQWFGSLGLLKEKMWSITIFSHIFQVQTWPAALFGATIWSTVLWLGTEAKHFDWRWEAGRPSTLELLILVDSVVFFLIIFIWEK